jgi:hypothetical protein
MHRSEVTPTLLNAILGNQAAITAALLDIAGWIESSGSPETANLVRGRLQVITETQGLVGACVGALMQTHSVAQ